MAGGCRASWIWPRSGGEVGQHLGPEIVGHDGQVILGLEEGREAVGGLERLEPGIGIEALIAVGELHHHGDGHGRFSHRKAGDLLRHVVLGDAEEFFPDLGDEVSLGVLDRDIHRHGCGVGGKGRHGSRHILVLPILGRDFGLVRFRGRGCVRGRVGGGRRSRLLAGPSHRFGSAADGALSTGEEYEPEGAG